MLQATHELILKDLEVDLEVNFEVELEVNLKINLGVTLGSSRWTYPELKQPSYVKISLSLKLEVGDKKRKLKQILFQFNHFNTVS